MKVKKVGFILSLALVVAVAFSLLTLSEPASASICTSCWKQVTSPNVGTGNNILNGVTAKDYTTAWAAGSYRNTSTGKDNTLIQKWDGTSWSTMTSPNQGTSHNALNAIALPLGLVDGNYDVWAVGSYTSTTNSFAQTLIERLSNGTGSWSIVSSPNQVNADNFLLGVAGSSPTNFWAVGYYSYDLSINRTLTLHWNGSSWQQITSPNPTGPNGPLSSYLTSVTVLSDNSAWAAGWYSNGYDTYPLVMEWNGTSWTDRSPVGQNGTLNPSLDGISFNTSSTGLTVGGEGFNPGVVGYQHTSTGWVNKIPTSNTGPLKGLAYTSATGAWAVGYRNVTGGVKTQTQYWNGSSWVYYQAIDPSGSNDVRFYGVNGIANTDTWGVGYYNNGTRKVTLIEHFSNY